MPFEPWRTAWHRALYGPSGFYRQPRGPAGHFATSAQGIPGVGDILARAVAALAAQYDLARVIDVGAGRGELLTQLRAIAPHLRLAGVDIVERPVRLAPEISWMTSYAAASLPEDLHHLSGCLVIAHEWLDVVPVTIAECDETGVMREVLVDDQGTESLGGPLNEANHQWCQQYWPDGARIEIGRARDDAWAQLSARMEHGVLLGVDYGHQQADRPAYGSLSGYRDGAQVPPVPDGSCDITAHVAVDSLATSWLTTQRELLTDLGLVAPPPQIALAHRDPARYLTELAARSAATAATARGGLGDFWWFAREIGVHRSG